MLADHDEVNGLLVPKRVLVQDTSGNWVARWVNNNKPDHYAHAEAYCLLALERAGRPRTQPRVWVEGQTEGPPGMQPSSYRQVISDTWYR